MKFTDFLKDRLPSLCLLAAALGILEIFLFVYHPGQGIRILVPVCIAVAYGLGLLVEYRKKNRYYRDVQQILDGLDQKYLLTEMLPEPDFAEGKFLWEVLQDTEKSRLEQVGRVRRTQEDFEDYIELWIHEVKIPIATAKLIVENNRTEQTRRLGEELDRIDDYTEQALYYARSSTVEKDYIIRTCRLQDMVNQAVKKNKNALISSKTRIVRQGLDRAVQVDNKWMVFILNQIIANSIKYAAETGREICFSGSEGTEQVVLTVWDNGVGIQKADVSRVFEKGFTGTNGRSDGAKSTGIGLYLCKKLCDKLGVGIELSSQKHVGTEVRLIFPKNSYVNF